MAARGRDQGLGGISVALRPNSDRPVEVARLVASLPDLDKSQLLLCWRNYMGGTPPAHLPTWLLARVLAFRLQAQAFGDVSADVLRKVKRGAEDSTSVTAEPFAIRAPSTREGADLRPGAMLAREWRGKLERVAVLEEGFAWNGKTFRSLSQVAKAISGTSWNGHRFFGLRSSLPSMTKPRGSDVRTRMASSPSAGPSEAAS
jgi:hypothetical protein